MRWRRSTTLLGGVVAAFVLAGCAAPGYNPSGLESELVRVGTTPAQARCITSGLTDTFARSDLGSHAAPSERELEKTRGIIEKCGVKLPLQPR